MTSNAVLFFSAVAIILTFAIGGIISWIYKETVDRKSNLYETYSPEFYDEEGQYINEELVAVRFIDSTTRTMLTRTTINSIILK